MAWITESDIERELGRLTSKNHGEDDVVLAITEATASAEAYLRAVVDDDTLASWDITGNDHNAPLDIVTIVSRLGAAIILNRFYGQSLVRVHTADKVTRAAGHYKLAIDDLKAYSNGTKRLVDRATDDQIAVADTFVRSGRNTTRKFETGTDSDPKKLDRL